MSGGLVVVGSGAVIGSVHLFDLDDA